MKNMALRLKRHGAPMSNEKANWLHIFDSTPAYLAFLHKQHGSEMFHEIMGEVVAARASDQWSLANDAIVLFETGLEDLAEIVAEYALKAPMTLRCPDRWICHNSEFYPCCGYKHAPGAAWNKDNPRKPTRKYSDETVQTAVATLGTMRQRETLEGTRELPRQETLDALVQEALADD
jgi:hypothetical protein